MRLLFVRLRSLGDTVLMTPAIETAARAGYEVAVAVERPFDEVLAGNPHLSRILTPGSGGKLLGRLELARRIRRFRPEVAVDLHGGSTAAWLTRASGARVRVGYASGRNRALYNHSVPESGRLWDKTRLHTVQHQLSPLKSLGMPVEPIAPLHVAVQPEAAHWAKGLLGGDATGRLVLVHPAAAFDTKQWAVERFAEVAEALIQEGHRVVATAGPGQQDLVEEMGTLTEGILTVPSLPLNRFVALAERCDLYIGNDTGPTHIAAALGKPIVVVFGSSDSGAWHPWGVPYRLLQSELECIPCPGYYCLHYDEPRCIRSVDVAPVVQAARELIVQSYD